MNDYRIEPKAEVFLHEKLDILLGSYFTEGVNDQRNFDFFRGCLEACFNLGLVSIKSFIFLFNFVRWLECGIEFEHDESIAFEYFLEDYEL